MRMTIRAGLLAGAMILPFGAAAAQTSGTEAPEADVSGQTAVDEPQGEEIIVTGSNIRRNALDQQSPVQVFAEGAPELAVAQTLTDFIANLPANAGSQLSNVGVRNPTLIGSANFNLRNLGAGSTLVLINGRRAGKSPLADPLGNQFFDLNTLPMGMIRRFDIQTDGASAIYGSEAVAGVVNVVTKLGFEGVEIDSRAEFSVNDTQVVNFAAGTTSDRGAFAVYASYYRGDMTFNTDFGFINDRLHDRNRDGLVDTTANGGPSNSLFLSTAGAPDEFRNFTNNVIGGTAVVDPDCAGAGGYVVGNQCLYDFAEQSSPIAGEERFSGFAEFRYDLGDWLGSDGVTAYGEIGVTRNRATRAGGPQATANGATGGRYTIPANHPFNYFVANGTGIRFAPGCFDTVAGNEGGACVSVPITTQDGLRPLGQSFSGRRASENAVFTNDAQRFMAGLRFDYGDWSVDGWAQRYTHESTRTEPGNWIASRLQAALDSGILNPFGSAEATPDARSLRNPAITAGNDLDELAAAGVLYTELERRRASQTTADFLVSNGNLFDLPGGAVGIAVGYQFRTEDFRFDPDPILGNGLGSDRRPSPDPIIEGETRVHSVFAEVVLPVFDGFEVQAALRHEDHGDVVGATTDPKIAARYNVTDWLTVRGSYGTSFQAPTPNQQGGIVSSGSVIFKTTGGQAICGGPDLAAFTVAQVGRPVDRLRPQSAENINLGFVINGGGFDASVDYWRYNYSDLIVNTQSAQAVLDASCDGVRVGDAPRASDLIVRAPNGQPVLITLALQNANNAVTDGLDMQLGYSADTGIGRLGARISASYVNSFTFNAGGTTTELVGRRNFTSTSFGTLPRWRGNLTGTFANGAHSAFAVVRYIGDYANADPITRVAVPRIDEFVTLDLQYGFNLEDAIGVNATLNVGANNAFDKDPPFVGNNRPGFDEQAHSPRGRVLYVGIQAAF